MYKTSSYFKEYFFLKNIFVLFLCLCLATRFSSFIIHVVGVVVFDSENTNSSWISKNIHTIQ